MVFSAFEREALLARRGRSNGGGHFPGWLAAILCFAALVAGCTPPYVAPLYHETSHGPTIYTPEQTVSLENSDRVARFQRLASLTGIMPPTIMVVQEGAVPVVEVIFSERVMFDFNSDIPRPEATAVLNLVADNMRRDVPDVQLTLLGHTDAIGSDEYNYDLSLRRAANVFQALVNRGCNPAQLSTVAIGKNQPIAPNDTEAGRLLNRRVEFLISASQDANLAVVRSRPINRTYLNVANERPSQPAAYVTVLKPVKEAVPPAYVPGMSSATHETLLLQPFGDIPLQVSPASTPSALRPRPPPIQQTPAPTPQLQQPAPIPELAVPGQPQQY